MKKELKKSPIFYFYDIGLRNFTTGILGNIKEKGLIFQNLIYKILVEKSRYSNERIFFWRTKDKAEVDFVIEIGDEIIPIEVKYKELKSVEITRSLKSFIDRYSPQKAYIVNLKLDEKVYIRKTIVNIIPFYKLLEI